jgi:fructosamine-3-kinase
MLLVALPQDCTFIAAHKHGVSLWAQTAKVTTITDDGDTRYFFVKIARGDVARDMFRGEFEGMTLIADAIPGFAPKPVAWGAFEDQAEHHYFLSQFVDMVHDGVPEETILCQKLAQLHKSVKSPTGKFGFHMDTCNGNIRQKNDWDDSWEVFFATGLRYMLSLDLEKNGEQPALAEAIQPIFDRVIPRLLRPLHGKITPSLVHGDLWCGNCANTTMPDTPVIFDAAVFYAHHEYELGNWRPARNNFTKEYINKYKSHYNTVEAWGFDDRLQLYELRFNFHYCLMVDGLGDIKQQ